LEPLEVFEMRARSVTGSVWALAICVLAAGGAVGCGSDDSGGGGAGAAGGADPIAKLPAGWNELVPGGDTICSRGTPFRYWVRPGSVNRLVVEFRGGGACWNELTCSLAGATFEEAAGEDSAVTKELVGIYRHSDDRNPFKDWHHVYIPYCTGDVHWGNATGTYGSGATAFTIEHKGAVNVRAVLDWVYENVKAPEKVFVTGCSAGAYGSILWSSHIRKHYATADVKQFADSGAGVITDEFFKESFPQWNALEAYPTFIPGLDPSAFDELPQLYTAIGNHFTDMFLSQYNTTYDDNQHFYYNAMGGGDASEWSVKMQASVAKIAASTPNFRSYRAPGTQHCIINQPNFYDITSGGVRLVDWISDVVADEDVPSVSCDPDCGAPQ
jgi:hypothetical protein